MDESTELERVAYLQRIDPDRREEYVAAHDDVPEAVTDAMERSGVTDFRLFVRGDVAVCVVEAPDVDAYFEEVTENPDVQEWERYVAQFKREGVDVNADADENAVPLMESVWSFEPTDS